ncbi:MAG: hypothetical protein WA746_03005 [Isosphaeraceae bacterium]
MKENLDGPQRHLLFGALDVVALFGVLASAAELQRMAGIIGTDKPHVARIVCAIAAVIGFGFAFVFLISLLGGIS